MVAEKRASSLSTLLFFLAFFAVGFGALSAFLLSARMATFSTALVRSGRRSSPSARRDALSHWGKTFGCPALHDGVDLTIPLNLAASAASLHAVRALDKRAELGDFLQALGKGGEGVEVGVQGGVFSETLLSRWNCSVLHLVDPWRQQAQYVDVANVGTKEQERLLADTQNRLARFKGRVRLHRDFSYNAVREFKDASLDFVYIDAVHDYEGAIRDFCDCAFDAPPHTPLAPLAHVHATSPAQQGGPSWPLAACLRATTTSMVCSQRDYLACAPPQTASPPLSTGSSL